MVHLIDLKSHDNEVQLTFEIIFKVQHLATVGFELSTGNQIQSGTEFQSKNYWFICLFAENIITSQIK